MRVLMFGWEFPPHITGGLGTACYGISHSLVKEGVELTFVVPKVLSENTTKDLKLVGAESVVLPLTDSLNRELKMGDALPKKTSIRRVADSESVAIRIEEQSRAFTTVEVNSLLTPYTTSGPGQKTWVLEDWNYVFKASPTERKHFGIEDVKKKTPRPIGYRYTFAGGYGPALMDEVRKYALVARELAKANSHNVVHAHDWMTFPAGYEASKVSKKPLVIHVHATEFDRTGRCEGAIYQIEKDGMFAADRIITVSHWTKNILIDHYNVPAEKITVIHNGISVTSSTTPKSVPPIGSQVVTFVGRITHQKGPRYFIEAARKVAERMPEVQFIVAGSGDLLPQILERVAQLRLSNRFHFTGFLTPEWIQRIWSMSRVYVMPSVSEPFGITPLEAIQAGVPVIISNQSGVAEVMRHALKVDFWNTDALAEAICSVLQYDSLSTMLREKGEGEARQLSWTKAAKKIKKLYEELV